MIAAGLLLVLMPALICLGFGSHAEQRRLAAEDWLTAFASELNEALGLPRYVGALFQFSREVTEVEFLGFAGLVLDHNPEVHVLIWEQRVPAAGRAGFVAAQRSAGLDEFEIYERGSDGRLRPAPPRDEYYVARYAAPEEFGRRVLGFTPTAPGTASERALRRALSAGQPSVSERTALMSADEPEPGFIIYQPVYAEGADAPLGLIAAGYRLRQLVAQIAPGGEAAGALVPYVFDVTDPDRPTLLYAAALEGDPAAMLHSGLTPAEVTGPEASSRDFAFGGRTWRVVIRQQPEAASPMWLLLLGLSLAAGVMLTALGLGQARILSRGAPATASPPPPAGDRQELDALRQLLAQAPDIVAREAPDGRVLYVSPAVRAVLGLSPEELVGRSMFDFLHPEDVYRSKRAQEQATQLPGLYTATLRFRRADGQYAWLETSSRLLPGAGGGTAEVITVARDVSELKAEALAVRDSEAMYRAAFENAPTPMVLADARAGSLLRVNNAFCELLGYSRSELRELNARDITHPADWELTVQHYFALAEGGRAVDRFRKRFLRKDGTAISAELLTTSLPDDQGRPRHLMSLILPDQRG